MCARDCLCVGLHVLVSQKCHVVAGWRVLNWINIAMRCVYFCVKVLIWKRVFHKMVSQKCHVVEGRCVPDSVDVFASICWCHKSVTSMMDGKCWIGPILPRGACIFMSRV